MAMNAKITVCSGVPHSAMHTEIETRPFLINTCVGFRIIRLNFVIEFMGNFVNLITRVETLIVATFYLQLIQNRYMFRSFTVLQCSHQHCVQPVASDVEVVGYF